MSNTFLRKGPDSHAREAHNATSSVDSLLSDRRAYNQSTHLYEIVVPVSPVRSISLESWFEKNLRKRSIYFALFQS